MKVKNKVKIILVLISLYLSIEPIKADVTVISEPINRLSFDL